MSIFKLYVLKSLRDSKRYIGYTSNLERRLLEHNKGMVKSTKKRKPFIVIYTESYDTRLAVIKREYYFKSRAGRRFMDDKGIK